MAASSRPPEGQVVQWMSLRQYTTRIAMTIGGMKRSTKRIAFGGSFREKRTNGKARVARMTRANRIVATTASDKGVMISSRGQ